MALGMAFLKGEPVIKKLAYISMLALPVAMAASLIYSPPDYFYRKTQAQSSSK